MIVELFDELGLERLACFDDWGGGFVGWMAEGFGFGIIAAGEDKGVETGDEIGCVAGDWREDDGDAAGLANGLSVGHGEVSGWAIFSDHEIGSDGDEWARILG